jgi:outer membrane protein OmpA-like peptidoglycan-associated protein
VTGTFTRVLCVLFLSVGCASTPRPRVLTELDGTREGPEVTASRTSAPQAFARAEGLRKRAEEAHESDMPATAQILGEQALVAYQRAVVLARLAAAETRKAQAETELARTEAALRAREGAQRELEATLRDLELRLKVERETMPLPASAASSPEREKARREAARALGVEARLLCATTRLLDPSRTSVLDVVKRLEAFELTLASAPRAPIDEARALRSACLRELTATRRAATQADPAGEDSDRLLASLSDASLAPARDDRGVVVTLSDPFETNDKLRKAALDRLTELAQIAKANPSFPVQVVVHSARALPPPRETARVEEIAGVLRTVGAPRVEAVSAGSALPVLESRRPGAAARNERVEVVFVTRTAS